MSTDEHRSSPASLSRKVRLETLNREFEQILLQYNEADKALIWQQINISIWCRIVRHVSVALVITCLIVLSTIYVPVLNWSATALGRIGLIKMLPFWNWTQYHRDRCIWEKKLPTKSVTYAIKDTTCDFCETIGNYI